MSMTDIPAPPAHSAIRVLAALAELGEATAAAVAEKAGLGYSTTTPKLRAWEDSGQAERRRTDDGRTLWRLAPAGRAATAAPADRHPTGDDPAIAAPPADTSAEPLAAPPAAAEPIPADPAGEPDRTAASGHTAPDEPGDGRPPSDAAGTSGTASAEDTDAVPAPPGSELIGRHDAPETETREGTEDGPPPGDGADAAPTVDTDHQDEAPAEPAPTATGEPEASTGEEERRPQRRSAGSMRAAILDIFHTHPDRPFKVGELCRLIDAANTGTRTARASQGAVYNAATKLAATGILTQTVEKPATFHLAARSD
jgi:hypothetical protein